LEYLGRVDGQVKVRGYRVELGEVEAVLASHPGVREAAAAVKGAGAEARLVGYYVREEGAEVSGAEVRQYLRGLVPEYLVPGVVVELERMPVSGSGKLDRKALPEGAAGREGAGEVFAPPRNAVEEVLVDIWTQLLGVERIGIDDNFFNLGGYSLLATQLILRVQAVFQVEIAIRTLFQSPTVAALAQAIVEQENRPGQAEKVARVLLKVKSMSAEDVNASLQGEQKEGVSA
jgi:acyl carrier protein